MLKNKDKEEIGLQSTNMLKQVQHYIKRVAFTLAEVLIALTIIGVVAAVTIPSLMQAQTEQATVTKVKKYYHVLSQAFDMAVTDYGPPSDWGMVSTNTGTNDEEGKPIYDTTSQLWLAKVLSQYMNVSKKCWEEGVDCTGNGDSYYLSGTKHDTNNFSGKYAFILNDGTIVSTGWTESAGNGDIAVYIPKSGKDMQMEKIYFILGMMVKVN